MCRGVTPPPSGTIVNGLPVSYSRQCATHSNSLAKKVRPRPMPSNSPFSRARVRVRADCSQKSAASQGKPQPHDLHRDGLRASLDPRIGVLASQCKPRLEGFRPRASAIGLSASRRSQWRRSTYQPKALEITPLAKQKAPKAQHFSTSCERARVLQFRSKMSKSPCSPRARTVGESTREKPLSLQDQ